MNHDRRNRNAIDPALILGVAVETTALLKAGLVDASPADIASTLPALFKRQLPLPTRQEEPFRVSVSSVSMQDGEQVAAGRVLGGQCSVSDEVFFSSTNRTAKIKHFKLAGDAIEITLSEALPIAVGAIASHVDHLPVLTDVFEAYVFSLSDEPLSEGNGYSVFTGALDATVAAQEVTTLSGELCKMVLRAPDMLALDEYVVSPATGSFLLSHGGEIVGAGIISMENYADQRDFVTQQSMNIKRISHRVPADERSERNSHEGGVLWLTGLSGSGKSTLALEVERRMFEKGYQAYVLDGDNLRHGLNSNLGFSPQDRSENIRRVGEVAALFSHAGMIAISAFISPYRADRDRARVAVGGNFHEIYISADVATCELRDPKDLYKKARAGEIKDFTGISAPYEAPEAPDLVVDTSAGTIEECTEQLLAYIEQHLGTSSKVS